MGGQAGGVVDRQHGEGSTCPNTVMNMAVTTCCTWPADESMWCDKTARLPSCLPNMRGGRVCMGLWETNEDGNGPSADRKKPVRQGRQTGRPSQG